MRHLSFFLLIFLFNSLNAQTLKPDSSFAETGKILFPSELKLNSISSVEFDNDGSMFIIGAGDRTNDKDSFFIYMSLGKLGEDGKLDENFAENYFIKTEHSEGQLYLPLTFVQKDGKILMSGHTFNMYNGELHNIAQRYNRDGSLDLNFGNNGTYFEGEGDFNFSNFISELPDGKILISSDNWIDDWRNAISFIKLNNDGSYDQSFGINGQVLNEYPDDELSTSIYTTAIQPDGKILVVGALQDEDDFSDFLIARFLENGDVDTEFANNGYLVFDKSERDDISDLFIQPDGKIIFIGNETVGELNDVETKLIAGRINPDGTFDIDFGNQGFLEFEESLIQGCVGGYINIDTEGQMYFSGTKFYLDDPNNITSDIFIMRLNMEGIPDKNFGIGGLHTEDFGGELDNLAQMKFDTSDRIVVYGESINFAGPSRGFIARYIPDLNLGKVDFETLKANVFTYPNPVGSECTLEYELLKDERISIDLLNSNGALIKRITSDSILTAGKNAQLIPMDGLAPGMYIIALNSGNNRISTKIIKQ